MKTTITFFVIILFFGCSKDEPAPLSNTDLLVGVWIESERDGVPFILAEGNSVTWTFFADATMTIHFIISTPPGKDEKYEHTWYWEEKYGETYLIMERDTNPPTVWLLQSITSSELIVTLSNNTVRKYVHP